MWYFGKMGAAPNPWAQMPHGGGVMAGERRQVAGSGAGVLHRAAVQAGRSGWRRGRRRRCSCTHMYPLRRALFRRGRRGPGLGHRPPSTTSTPAKFCLPGPSKGASRTLPKVKTLCFRGTQHSPGPWRTPWPAPGSLAAGRRRAAAPWGAPQPAWLGGGGG